MFRGFADVEENLHLSLTAVFTIPETLSYFSDVDISPEFEEILDETIIAKELELEEKSGIDGRYATWRGDEKAKLIEYSSLLSLQSTRYQISRQLSIPDNYAQELKGYLTATRAIPVNHPEIEELQRNDVPMDTEIIKGVDSFLLNSSVVVSTVE